MEDACAHGILVTKMFSRLLGTVFFFHLNLSFFDIYSHYENVPDTAHIGQKALALCSFNT